MKVKKNIWKCINIFDFYFSIVHMSSNNVFGSLNICMHVGNIHIKGTVSQIHFLILVFILCQKTFTFYLFF